MDAAGDAITGGLIARAIEGEAGDTHHTEGACLNCGTALVGAYCHACGQSGHIHRSIGAIWHDLAHGVFHFEGKIWRTLPMLAWQPGALTRRYIHGERARFISPLALFLFSVFLMFAVINTFGGHLDDLEIKPEGRQQIGAQLSDQLRIQKRGVAETERKLAEAKAAGQPTQTLSENLATRQKIVKEMEGASTPAGGGTMPNFANVKTGWPKLDKGIAKATANPSLALYKIQTSAYKYSWALIPISVPFVWMMFAWHRKRHIYDHTIFVTYSLAFMSLLCVLLTLMGVAGAASWVIAALATIVPPVHFYRQIKGAYETGRFATLVRTCLLLIFSSIALTLFLLLLLGMGLLG